MRTRRGMTMVEILIAASLFVILVIGLVNFMLESRTTTSHLLDQGDNLRESRLALAYMERDVRSGHGIVQAVDNEDFLTFTIKRVTEIVSENAADDKVEYITYNYLKKNRNIDGKDLLAGTLTRSVQETEPAEGFLSAQKILVRSEVHPRTGKIIGLMPEALITQGDGSQVAVKSGVQFFNQYFDPSFLRDPDMASDLKPVMAKTHTWQGKHNGAEVGYTEVKDSVALRIRFVMGDSRDNYELFYTMAWMRCMMLGRRDN